MEDVAKKEAQLARDTFAQEYPSALASFLDGAGETSLRRAYEVGRCAILEGTSLLDVAILHHEALGRQLVPEAIVPEARQSLLAAGQFLAESLSPYEMAYRGFQEANAALRHINEALEQEAKRIAHLLHDEVGQTIFAARLALANVEPKVNSPLAEELQYIGRIVAQVEDQLRSFSHQLRPTILDDLGLIPALEFLAQGITKRTNISITVKALVDCRLPSPIESSLYRVVQEALRNVAKHSNATQAETVLEQQGATLLVVVRDNGVGCDMEAWRNKDTPKGLGLIGVRERLASLGGTLEIRSQPGQGMELLMTVPCEV